MIDYDMLKNWRFDDVEHRYDADDSMLYALGLGLGADPMDERQLRFVDDTNDGMPLALPTQAVILGWPGSWMRDPRTGIDFSMIVHGEERVVWHRPIPAAGTVVARHRIAKVVDKGEGRGAIVVYDKELVDKASGAALATITHTTFCRGNGGFSAATGRTDKADAAPPPVPARAPDIACEMATLPQQALLYRLSADRNPLHSNPEAARRAGFERPILHGLCTWGIAGHALLAQCCDYEPSRLAQMYARFSSPVYPGESLRFEIWREGGQGEFAFRAKAIGRDKIVLDHGRASVRA